MAFTSGSRNSDFDTQLNLNDPSTTIAIADNGFSIAADLDVYTNTVNARTASFAFRCNYTGGFADENSGIVIFAQQLNIDPADTGTADQPYPSLSYLHDSIASVPLLNSTGVQLNTYGGAPLRGVKAVQEYQFVIWNRSGEIIPSGWTLFITPTAVGVVP